jgi:hypothetical protein
MSSMLQPITMSDLFFAVSTTPLLDGGGTTSSSNTLFVPKFDGIDDVGTAMNDIVCFVGTANNLDASVLSTYGGVDGTDCSNPNGCGVHVSSSYLSSHLINLIP